MRTSFLDPDDTGSFISLGKYYNWELNILKYHLNNSNKKYLHSWITCGVLFGNKSIIFDQCVKTTKYYYGDQTRTYVKYKIFCHFTSLDINRFMPIFLRTCNVGVVKLFKFRTSSLIQEVLFTYQSTFANNYASVRTLLMTSYK